MPRADGGLPPARWAWLGRVHHDDALALQERLRAGLARGEHRAPGENAENAETLLLCEHHPVITLGRSTRPEHLLATEEELRARGVDLRPVSRGGSGTYHGPGQLVGYPVFRVRTPGPAGSPARRHGVVGHVEGMAEAVVALLTSLGLSARFRRDHPGVWVRAAVGEAKICALGVHVRHRVAIHGLALNVSCDLDAFSAIVPCGLAGADGAVTSLTALGVRTPPLAELAEALAASIAGVFSLDMRSATSSTLQMSSAAL